MTRYGPLGENDEDDDPFFEAYDAQIDRVDLVSKAASGGTFVLMKSAQDGPLMTPEAIRDLIAKSTATPEKSTMSKPSFHDKFIPGTATLKIRRTPMTKAKAKTSTMVACYDATGVLIGMVAQDAITALAAPTNPNAPKAVMPAPKPAPIVPPDATDGPAAQAQEEVTKALAGGEIVWVVRPIPLDAVFDVAFVTSSLWEGAGTVPYWNATALAFSPTGGGALIPQLITVTLYPDRPTALMYRSAQGAPVWAASVV